MIFRLQFRIADGTLELTQVFKVIISIHCYEELIKFMHATTLKHLGVSKTIAYLKSNCILPDVDKIARLCISKCRECAMQKAFTHSTHAHVVHSYKNCWAGWLMQAKRKV